MTMPISTSSEFIIMKIIIKKGLVVRQLLYNGCFSHCRGSLQASCLLPGVREGGWLQREAKTELQEGEPRMNLTTLSLTSLPRKPRKMLFQLTIQLKLAKRHAVQWRCVCVM